MYTTATFTGNNQTQENGVDEDVLAPDQASAKKPAQGKNNKLMRLFSSEHISKKANKVQDDNFYDIVQQKEDTHKQPTSTSSSKNLNHHYHLNLY